ncbi:MAG: glycosyltransferase [Methanobacteriaceae archaeon]
MLFKGLNQCNNVDLRLLSQDDSIIKGDDIFGYLFFSLLEVPFKVKESDIYHALSPIESIRLNKKKSVVTIHDLMLLKIANIIYPNNKFMSKAMNLFFKKAMGSAIKCEKIVAISDETAGELNQYYNIDLDSISVVRQAIASYFYPNSNFNSSFLNNPETNDKFTVGTISNINNRKRIDILINSFLEADIEDSCLLIGGKGPQLDELKRLAGNDSRIKFLGFVANEDMNDFYNSLDVFVFPSIMEGYGIPLVEAMACGKPVITLVDGYIPSDIKDRTFVTSELNLANVLTNREFKCNIKSNIQFAKEHSIENMAKEMIKVYDDMI